MLWDPTGMLCLLVLYSAVIIIAGAVNFFALLPAAGLFESVEIALYNSLVALLLACHICCMTTNPGRAKDFVDQDLQHEMRQEFQRLCAAGVPPHEAAQCQDMSVKVWNLPRRKWWCTKCDTYRPERAHHCKKCGCCVLEMDHHCPWVNNCIGLRNHKYFLLFLAYAWLACWWSLLRLSRALLVADIEPMFATAVISARFSLQSTPAQLLSLVCAAASFLFLLFVTAMGCDQWTFLEEGYGIVDQKLQAKHSFRPAEPGSKVSAPRSMKAQLFEVVGGGEKFSISWFLPIAPAQMQEAPALQVDCASRLSARTSVHGQSEPAAFENSG